MQYLLKFFSAKTKCTTFDKLRFENNTRKKASLVNLPLPSRLICIAVSLASKNEIVYLTKPEITQIHAGSVGELIVT